jgi:type III secretory pathway component EscR
MFVCMYVCVFVCMHVCMYVCICMHVHKTRLIRKQTLNQCRDGGIRVYKDLTLALDKQSHKRKKMFYETQNCDQEMNGVL